MLVLDVSCDLLLLLVVLDHPVPLLRVIRLKLFLLLLSPHLLDLFLHLLLLLPQLLLLLLLLQGIAQQHLRMEGLHLVLVVVPLLEGKVYSVVFLLHNYIILLLV